MYHLTVTLTETVGAWFCRAILSDFDDQDVGVCVATHGPLPLENRAPGDQGMQEVLTVLTRYAIFLQGPAYFHRDVEIVEKYREAGTAGGGAAGTGAEPERSEAD
jgi:hypothetical protein